MMHHESISASENAEGFFLVGLATLVDGMVVGMEGKTGLGADEGMEVGGGGKACVGRDRKVWASVVASEVVS